jgi:hypothetical protein
LRKTREWLESQPAVVRNRQGNEYPTANAREMSGSGLSPGLLVGGHVE